MNEIAIHGLYLLAGLLAYASITHFAVAIQPPYERSQFLFAGMCTVLVPFAIFHARALEVDNLTDFITALKWNAATILLFFLLFIWFISEYSHRRPKAFLFSLSALLTLLIIVNQVLPYSLQFESIEALKTLEPSDGSFVRAHGTTSPWLFLAIVSVLLSLGFSLTALGGSFYQHRRRSDLWMLVALGVFFLCAIEAILVRLSIIHFIPLGMLGVIAMVLVMAFALTHETQQRLRNSEKNFRSIFEHSPTAMFAIEPLTGLIKHANSNATRLTGYSSKEIENVSIADLTHANDSGESKKQYLLLLSGQINHVFYEKLFVRKDGSSFHGHSSISAIKDEDGEHTLFICSTIDITERKRAEAAIERLAYHDPLTRLPNRLLLADRLKQAIASSLRTNHAGALLFIDLDNFKSLNDTLGHDMGDFLLQQVGQRLEACVRAGDTVARLGGDEFLVMLLDLSADPLETATQAESIGEKILASFSEQFFLNNHVYRCTASIGITLFSDFRQSMDELMKQADIAMYQSKKAGRNTLRFFDQKMQENIFARVSLESEMHVALEKDQFRLHFQRQVDNSQRTIGAEALIRWQHPLRGMLTSEKFILLAEETGLILPIGQWVLDTACAQLSAWQKDASTSDLVLAVNVSAKQFRQVEFVPQVQTVVEHHGINPALLKLELTESLMLENIEETITTINKLNDIGVQISLDDFGTGYSSLQYLKRLPLDQLKIDQSFVQDIATDSNDQAIVSTIIAMAHSMGLEVIAEGVETEEQQKLLMEKGCYLFQGHLYGWPVPVEEFEASLKQDSVRRMGENA